MLDRVARIQLAIFAIVTVLCVGAIAIFYLHVPAKLGFGSYRITAEFERAGGLYQNANVAYRGVTVGRVESVTLSNTGVDANMRLNDTFTIPANVTATVKSVSAIGEQYVDLVPPDNPSGTLHNGSVIHNGQVGQDVEGLLKQADALVSSINNSQLQKLLHQTFRAFNGTGPELARLIHSAR